MLPCLHMTDKPEWKWGYMAKLKDGTTFFMEDYDTKRCDLFAAAILQGLVSQGTILNDALMKDAWEKASRMIELEYVCIE